MANFSKIVCTASGISSIGAQFTIRLVNTSRSISVDLVWVCKAVRSIAYQYQQGTGTNDQGLRALIAVSSDVISNSTISSYINVATASNAFQIEANEYGWTITDQGAIGATNLSFVETAESLPAKNFQLVSNTLSNGDIPCSEVLVTISETDGVAPYTWITPAIAGTTLQENIARIATNQFITITIEDADTDQASLYDVFIPRLFTSAEISSISVVTNGSGLDATVTVFMATDGSEFGGYEYSLDGSNFVTSNVFPNVLAGSYTLYVREGFLCVATTTFDVDLALSIERPNPYHFYSLANSIQMIEQKINKYSTVKNALYRDRPAPSGFHKPFYAQPYQTNDGIVPSQYDTNYDTHTARLINYCTGEIERTLSPTQKTENQGITDKRDAIAFNKGNNKTGLYFTEGAIYDPVTDLEIDTYELNGSLPEWAVIGNTIILSGVLGGSYLIKQVIFDSTVQAYAVIFDLAWTAVSQSLGIIVECTYDRLPYETWEFNLDLGGTPFLDGVYYTQLILEDSLAVWPQVVYNGALLNIKESHDRTVFIEYDRSDTAGLNFDTGYSGMIRLLSLSPEHTPENGSELTIYADTNKEETLLDYKDATLGEYFIQETTIDMWTKIKLISGHENIYVNGEKWTAIEGATIENFPQSEVKNITLKMSRNNDNQYNNDNINIDGDVVSLDQEEGAILQ